MTEVDRGFTLCIALTCYEVRTWIPSVSCSMLDTYILTMHRKQPELGRFKNVFFLMTKVERKVRRNRAPRWSANCEVTGLFCCPSRCAAMTVIRVLESPISERASERHSARNINKESQLRLPGTLYQRSSQVAATDNFLSCRLACLRTNANRKTRIDTLTAT